MIDCYTVIFLVVVGETIFSVRMNFIIIISAYYYLLLAKQKGGKWSSAMIMLEWEKRRFG